MELPASISKPPFPIMSRVQTIRQIAFAMQNPRSHARTIYSVRYHNARHKSPVAMLIATAIDGFVELFQQRDTYGWGI